MAILGFEEVSIVAWAEAKKETEQDSHFDVDSDGLMEHLVGSRDNSKDNRVGEGDFHAQTAGTIDDAVAFDKSFHRVREAGVEEVGRADKEFRF